MFISRERASKQGRDRQRGRQTESQAASALSATESQTASALSAQSLMQGLNSNREIMTWAKIKSQMLNSSAPFF